MAVLLDSAMDAASAAIAQIKGDLCSADILALNASAAARDQSAKTKAWAYVWLEAVSERCVKSMVQAVLTEINSSAIPKNRLRKTLFAVVLAPGFQALRTAKALRGMSQRTEMLLALDDVAPVVLNLNESVLDNRTIRGEHFDCLWRVFGFPLPSLPSPRHVLALGDLAEGRNEVAHGHVEPVSFGSRKAATDVIRLAEMLEEALEHFWSAADNYLTNRDYQIP